MTEQLRKQYTPLIVGTWHIERITDKMRYFERLTFQTDGKLSGMRKWQTRQRVTIDGEEVYTDWESVEGLEGLFSGTYQLNWERDDKGVGQEVIHLYAAFDNPESEFYAFSHNVQFGLVGDDILRFRGSIGSNNDGWTEYQKGDAEPSF